MTFLTARVEGSRQALQSGRKRSDRKGSHVLSFALALPPLCIFSMTSIWQSHDGISIL